MAVASAGIASSAASATSSMPSGRQTVCLESMNQVLRLPDFKTKSPVRTEWVRKCSMSASLATTCKLLP